MKILQNSHDGRIFESLALTFIDDRPAAHWQIPCGKNFVGLYMWTRPHRWFASSGRMRGAVCRFSVSTTADDVPPSPAAVAMDAFAAFERQKRGPQAAMTAS